MGGLGSNNSLTSFFGCGVWDWGDLRGKMSRSIFVGAKKYPSRLMYFKCNVHQPRRASSEIGILAREFFYLPVSKMLDRLSYFTNQFNNVETVDNTIDPAIAGTIPPI